MLKKKRDALKARFQALLKDIVDTKLSVGQSLKDAALSFAKAQWASSGDDIAATVMERAKRPSVTCKLQSDNVAGVSIPVFKLQHDPTKDSSVASIGIAHGGAVVNACRGEYFKSVAALVRLASLQTAFKTLDEEIKMTGRRVNALEYVLIPRIESVCHYITQEMDEEAREEFFRVKKVVEKKRAKIEKEKLAALLEEAAEAEAAGKVTKPKPAAPAPTPKPAAAPPAPAAPAPAPAPAPAAAPAPKAEPAPAPTPAPEAAEQGSPGAEKKHKKKGKKHGGAHDAPSAIDSKKDDDLVF